MVCEEDRWHGRDIHRSSGAGLWSWLRVAEGSLRWLLVWGSANSRSITRRRQARIDAGVESRLTSTEKAELMAAKRRIRELESEVAIHRRATELLKDEVSPLGGSQRSG